MSTLVGRGLHLLVSSSARYIIKGERTYLSLDVRWFYIVQYTITLNTLFPSSFHLAPSKTLFLFLFVQFISHSIQYLAVPLYIHTSRCNRLLPYYHPKFCQIVITNNQKNKLHHQTGTNKYKHPSSRQWTVSFTSVSETLGPLFFPLFYKSWRVLNQYDIVDSYPYVGSSAK